MGRYSSDSDSDRKRRSSSKRSKKKSKSRRRRSRSSSYDRRPRDRRTKSRSRSRTRSYSSERSRRSRSRDDRRKRRSPRRRRSRSRTDSRDREYSHRYKTRSRSRSRERSKKKKAKKHSRSRDHSPSPKKEKIKTKDPMEDIPGFAEMTLTQQSRLRVQAAFKSADTLQKDKSANESPVEDETALDQLERAQVLEDIDDDGFVPSYFKSSRSSKAKDAQKASPWPTDLIDQEGFHEMAIFGNSNALGLDEKSKKEISDASDRLNVGKRTIKWEERDLKTLAHPNLDITFEEAEKRWLDKLKTMRIEKAKNRGL